MTFPSTPAKIASISFIVVVAVFVAIVCHSCASVAQAYPERPVIKDLRTILRPQVQPAIEPQVLFEEPEALPLPTPAELLGTDLNFVTPVKKKVTLKKKK